MPQDETTDLQHWAIPAIRAIQKDAVIDLLDDYCGVSCYADMPLKQLQDDLLTAYKKKRIPEAEIIERFFASL